MRSLLKFVLIQFNPCVFSAQKVCGALGSEKHIDEEHTTLYVFCGELSSEMKIRQVTKSLNYRVLTVFIS